MDSYKHTHVLKNVIHYSQSVNDGRFQNDMKVHSILSSFFEEEESQTSSSSSSSSLSLPVSAQNRRLSKSGTMNKDTKINTTGTCTTTHRLKSKSDAMKIIKKHEALFSVVRLFQEMAVTQEQRILSKFG